jgi:hypothetical protein
MFNTAPKGYIQGYDAVLCRECLRDARDGRKHRCHYNAGGKSCSSESTNDSEYCSAHKCEDPACKKQRNLPNAYCSDHHCQVKQPICYEKPLEKFHYCETHRCKKQECDAPHIYLKIYCSIHACLGWGCREENFSQTSKYCKIHKCKRQGCNAPNAPNNGKIYCKTHTCAKWECSEENLSDNGYCKIHKCEKSECNNECLSDNKYCQNHFLKKCRNCSEPPEKFKNFCEKCLCENIFCDQPKNPPSIFCGENYSCTLESPFTVFTSEKVLERFKFISPSSSKLEKTKSLTLKQIYSFFNHYENLKATILQLETIFKAYLSQFYGKDTVTSHFTLQEFISPQDNQWYRLDAFPQTILYQGQNIEAHIGALNEKETFNTILKNTKQYDLASSFFMWFFHHYLKEPINLSSFYTFIDMRLADNFVMQGGLFMDIGGGKTIFHGKDMHTVQFILIILARQLNFIPPIALKDLLTLFIEEKSWGNILDSVLSLGLYSTPSIAGPHSLLTLFLAQTFAPNLQALLSNHFARKMIHEIVALNNPKATALIKKTPYSLFLSQPSLKTLIRIFFNSFSGFYDPLPREKEATFTPDGTPEMKPSFLARFKNTDGSAATLGSPWLKTGVNEAGQSYERCPLCYNYRFNPVPLCPRAGWWHAP